MKNKSELRECPHCWRMIESNLKKCPYCGKKEVKTVEEKKSYFRKLFRR